jgi:hypothetical protein
MLQAVSCRPGTVEVRVRSQAIPYETCGGLNVFLRVLPSFPISAIPPILYSFVYDRSYVFLTIDCGDNNALKAIEPKH